MCLKQKSEWELDAATWTYVHESDPGDKNPTKEDILGIIIVVIIFGILSIGCYIAAYFIPHLYGVLLTMGIILSAYSMFFLTNPLVLAFKDKYKSGK